MKDKISEKPNISLLSAISLSTTCMIGSGWLFSAQLSAKIAGNWSFLAWILTAIFVLTIGICLSVVVYYYPIRGATTRSSALSHNNIFGMPFAFANWFAIVVVIATEAQATTQYLSAAINSDILIYNGYLTFKGKYLSLIILSIYLVINYYGIKFLAKLNNLITLLKVFTPVFAITVLIIFGFQYNTGVSSNFNLTTNNAYTIYDSIRAIVGAGLVYSFNGFQVSASFASEIKNPKKNIPLAIILSIFIILFIYIGLQYAFMQALPNALLIKCGGWQGLNLSSPLLNLALILEIKCLSTLLLIDSVISPSGTGYTYLGACSRMLYAMSKEKQMPRWISKLDPKFNFSKRSIWINFVLAAIIILATNNWSELMIVVTCYHIIGYMAAPISMGAITPKLRYIGLVIFVMISIMIITIPIRYLMMVNISITLLLIIYSTLQYKNMEITKLLLFILPFTIYLWIVYVFHTVWIILIASTIFYLLVTNKRYVKICNKYKIIQ